MKAVQLPKAFGANPAFRGNGDSPHFRANPWLLSDPSDRSDPSDPSDSEHETEKEPASETLAPSP
jgi:hypothetical protein